MKKVSTLALFTTISLLVLVGCSKENSVVPTITVQPSSTNTDHQEIRENWDVGLAEANIVFANLFRVVISEGINAFLANSTGNFFNNCTPDMATLYSNGLPIQLQMDFGAECEISPGVFVSGIFIIRTPSGSIDGSVESNPGFIRFESVTVNGCKITSPTNISQDIFRFHLSDQEVRADGNTYNSYDFTVLNTSGFTVENLETNQISTFTPVGLFTNGLGNFPLIRLTTLSTLELNYADLLTAVYELQLLPVQGTSEPAWQVQSFDGNVYRLITDDNADLILSPSCAAIIDGTLQVRAITAGFPIVKAFNYGISDEIGTSPSPALCDNWAQMCYYENGLEDYCVNKECFSTQ